MKKEQLDSLQQFLEKASSHTYAGDGERTEAWRPGFYELEYSDGDWKYRDSFAGYLSSHGQKVVWWKEKPVWMCSYFGGMQEGFRDPALADKAFDFLKRALLEKGENFQPRGPRSFLKQGWEYKNDWSGGIEEFRGKEEIYFKNDLVFVHEYFGGLLRDGRV